MTDKELKKANAEIESLQAENERLRKTIEKTDAAYFQKVGEIERLESKNSELEYDLSLLRQEREGVVKAEAYKEFAERLKEKYGYYDWENKTIVYPDEEIDNLLKEIIGE